MNRRRFLARAAAGATLPLASGTLSAADAPATSPEASGITAETIAAAEKLAAVDFSPEQRALLAKDLVSRAAGYREVRRNPLPNSVAPALSLHLPAAPRPGSTGAAIPAA